MKHTRNPVPDRHAPSVFPELAPVRQEENIQDSPPRRRRISTKIISLKEARSDRPKEQGDARATTLSFTNMDAYGGLLVRYLKARKTVFIDRLKWDLPQTEGMEFDQYDTPLCRWVIIHEYGEILAGIRLVPTTAQCGTYSYMLRDAQQGKLHDIPTDVLFFDAPVDKYMWEASRLFVSEEVPAHRRSYIQYMLMMEMSRAANAEGARHVIGIVPAVFSRWLRRLGMYAVPVGRRFEIDGIASQAALFNVAELVARDKADRDRQAG